MICFYHGSDLDGHCSGAIVKMKYPECELVPVDYGVGFPWNKVKDEDIIMVDFCLQPFDDMFLLKEKANSLIWIDHHQDKIKQYKKQYLRIDGLRINGIAGCELTYQYFYNTFDLPTFVSLLGRYDVWDHDADPRVMPFQLGMSRYNTLPDNQEFWLSLFDYEKVMRIVEDGSIILEYRDKENEKYVKACAFETELEGHRCLAVNKMLTNSQIFDSIWDNAKYDFMVTFGWWNGAWTVSIYTDKEGYDGSKISKKYGGGGHKQASGFQCKELPFKLK